MNLESRQSSRKQQNSKALKEKLPSRQENQNLKHQGKLTVKASVGSPCTYLPRELRKEADGNKILVQPKSSGNHQSQYPKGKAIKEDELVKYMSKLPGYLKSIEGGKNVQDKVLNVGVLDWASLEEWKCNHKYNIARGSNNVSAIKPCTFSSVTQRRTPSLHSLNSSKKDGLSRDAKPSSQTALHFQDFETSSKSNLGGLRKMPWTNKSFDRNNADVTPRKGKTRDCDQKLASEMGSLSIDLGKYVVAISPKEKVSSWDGEVEEAQVSRINRKDLDEKTFADMGTSYPKSRSIGVSLGSKEKICAGNVETKKITEKLKESNIDLGHQHLPGKLENLLPKDLYQNSSPKESGVALDESLVEANQNRFSAGNFSPVKSCSAELSSDIPHSYPLSSEVENKLKTNLMAHKLINSQHAELSSDASNSSSYSGASSAMLSDGEDAEQNTIKHMNANADQNLKLLDQEIAEMAVTRFSNPSPNRNCRFSFSLSRMGRSFSWKESSGVPQLSLSYVSVKSGPVKSEEVSRLDDYSRQKINGHNRARPSPLRRILEPLLRSRSSNWGHTAEAVPPLKGNSSELNFRPVVDSASLPNKMHEASTTQSLLQVTMKNGLPLFKFVVDNNSSVLAATVKNLTSGKDDSGQNYTFYSVNEIKKKGGGWISQGSKQSCSFVYNVIGQMVSSSNFSNPKSQNLKNQYMVRESVLFGVELKQVDQASPKFMPNKELAAVVVKMPIESLNHDTEQRDNDMTDKDFKECFPRSYSSEGNENSCSTTVILPSGIHGLPDKGTPSPLIERWKSGGLCDCGGWDVGCKVHTLANRSQMTSISCSNSNSFELFEGGDQQNMPIFSLVPLNKEIYSVEFNSSMSLLQAFFVSVTVISGQKSYDTEFFQEEPVTNESRTKKSSLTNIVLGEMPAKYAPNPPHSPVGRA